MCGRVCGRVCASERGNSKREFQNKKGIKEKNQMQTDGMHTLCVHTVDPRYLWSGTLTTNNKTQKKNFLKVVIFRPQLLLLCFLFFLGCPSLNITTRLFMFFPVCNLALTRTVINQSRHPLHFFICFELPVCISISIALHGTPYIHRPYQCTTVFE